MASVLNNKPVMTETDEIEFGRIIGEIIDHKKVIFGLTIGVASLALLYSIFATPVYQADALVQVEQKQGNAILNSLNQMLPDSQPQSAPEISLLQSRMILGKTVDDLKLQTEVSEKHFPIIGNGIARLTGDKDKNIDIKYLKVDEVNYDSKNGFIVTIKDKNHFEVESDNGKIDGVVGVPVKSSNFELLISSLNAPENTEFYVRHLTRIEAINKLQKYFTATDQGKDTGMLSLTLQGSDKKKVSVILNQIMENYLEQNVARQAAQDAKSLDFLSDQLPKVQSDLDSAENKLNEYRRKKDSVDLTLEAKSVLDQIVNVDNQLNNLTFREAEVSQLYTKEHPTYKALLEKRQTLQNEKIRLNKQVSVMPATQQEVLRLSRDVESGRAVYMQLLNRQQELNIAKSSAIGYVRIVDSALTGVKPVSPNKILLTLGGVIIGFLLSIGFILTRVLLRKGIESPEQLESIGISVYASVPVSETITNKVRKNSIGKGTPTGLLTIESPTDLAVEAIRSLRTSLHFAMLEAKNNILLISGASPGVGKTFISTNLSATISSASKKVLLIDADMRKGYIHKMFGHHKSAGLSDVLAGKQMVESVIEKIPSSEVDYIGRGQVPPNPAELLMNSRLEKLLEWASKHYDLVIIDTPPILAVTDASIIARHAGTTLLVARHEINTIKEIEVSVKRFEQSGIIIKGCILNGVIKRASSQYGYGYNYYGYSYSDSDKK